MAYRPSHNIDQFGVTQTPQYQMVNGQAVEALGGSYVGQGNPGKYGYLDRSVRQPWQLYDQFGNIQNDSGQLRKLDINQGLHQSNNMINNHSGPNSGPNFLQQTGGHMPYRAMGTYLNGQQQSNSALNPTGNQLTSRLMR
jgi:hypothetical protein